MRRLLVCIWVLLVRAAPVPRRPVPAPPAARVTALERLLLPRFVATPSEGSAPAPPLPETAGCLLLLERVTRVVVEAPKGQVVCTTS